ncbi:MAG: mononuclear molybdenum enzyme YedY, partial [Bacteroidia bacterium]|nr:mononuclear molybdenum enzyme YedY [Bacteroidia bacterium]
MRPDVICTPKSFNFKEPYPSPMLFSRRQFITTMGAGAALASLPSMPALEP